ncbi:MAG: hypothetical protein HY721_18105, partial [Planctomycetes bacterium]|nr:hypothetical protein [Planctomycetota bacterium]
RMAADLLDQAGAALVETAAAGSRSRLPGVRALRRRIDAFAALAGAARVLDRHGLDRGEAAALRRDLRLLERARRRSRKIELEVLVQARLERACGPRGARLLENGVLLLVLAFVGLVIVEWRLPRESPWLPAVLWTDAALCLLFQADFAFRWALSGGSGRYFLRHFFLESLPALPYGLILEHAGTLAGFLAFEEVRAVVVARLLRLRGFMVLAARVFRLTAFLVRGSDRAVERLRPLLDRDVVLFDHDPLAGAPADRGARRILALEERRRRAARHLFAEVPGAERAGVLRRHLESLDVEARLWARLDLPYRPEAALGAGQEVHVERVVRRLLDCDASLVLAQLGGEGARRVARWLRWLDAPLLRSLPLLRRLVPAGRLKSEPEAVAAAANVLGEALQDALGVLRFWGDLAGITTGPQVLDRVATALITATQRPAVRLLFFGGLFLVIKGLTRLLGPGGLLDEAARGLVRILGAPLLILGGVCLVALLAGRWLKRLAGETLDIYLRTADAHFYPLLKTWKRGRSDRDARRLYRSVFLPELDLRGGPADEDAWVRFLLEALPGPPGAPPPAGSPAPTCAGLEAYAGDRRLVALLYQDFLDGPILHRADDKTSVQLLGSLFVQDVRFGTLGMTRKQARRLESLDLEKDRLLGLGPYFWFRFITESLAIETAKLVMEYGTHCIPLEELPFASEERRRRFEEFLESRRCPWDVAVERRAGRAMGCLGQAVVAGELTALDFLASTPARDEAIRARYGDEVLAALRRDRQGVVRDVFGTRPYHLLPRGRRVFNPYGLYRRYLSGLRVFLLPLTLAWGLSRVLGATLLDVLRLVGDILGREAAPRPQPSRAAGFDVAVRKVHRMRKPFFMEALKLRAVIDVEYLGLRVPGGEREAGSPSFREDLDFIGALESERRPLEALRAAAVRDLRRFRQHLAARGWLGDGFARLLSELDPSGGLERRPLEAMRALVTAYVTDHGSLRSIVTAGVEARDLVERALEEREGPWRRTWRGLRAGAAWASPSARRRKRLLERYLGSSAELAGLPRAARRKVLRAFLAAPPAAERAVALAGRGGASNAAVLAALRSAAADHAAWTRKIVMIRALQAITVMDIESYCDLVWAAGGYGEASGALTTSPPGAAPGAP